MEILFTAEILFSIYGISIGVLSGAEIYKLADHLLVEYFSISRCKDKVFC